MPDLVAYFNTAAATWDSLPKADSTKLAYIASFIPDLANLRVIDAGCGTGIMLPFIKALVDDSGIIYAVDFAAEMLGQAQAKYNWPNLEFIQGDVTALNLPPGTIDAIICYSLYPHLKNKESAVNEFARLLKPVGRLIIAHSKSRKAINEIHHQLGGPVAEDLLPPAADTAAICRQFGLKVLESRDDDECYLVVAEK